MSSTWSTPHTRGDWSMPCDSVPIVYTYDFCCPRHRIFMFLLWSNEHGPQNVSRLFIRSILQPSLSAIALAIGSSGCMHTYYLRSPSSTPAPPPHHVWNHVGLRLQYLDTPSPAPVTCTFDECLLPSIDASLTVTDRQISHQ